MRRLLRQALCLACLIYTPALFAQPNTEFSDCTAATGRSASLIIPLDAAVISDHTTEGTPIQDGAKLAVFTPQGVCAGTITWNNEAAALAIWGDDPVTPKKDGFVPGDTLIYRLRDASTHGEFTATSVRYAPPSPHAGRYVSDAVYLVSEMAFSRTPSEAEPEATLTFEPNYPNPFTYRTTFRYRISEPTHVRLDLYDLLGRRVATLVDEPLSAGWHEASLQATGLGSGSYIARLSAGAHTETQRVTLVR